VREGEEARAGEGDFRGPGADNVAILEPGLWRRLTNASTPDEAAMAWVPLMFAMLEDADLTAVFLVDAEGGRLRAPASFPAARMPSGDLLSAAEAVREHGRGVIRGDLPDSEGASPSTSAGTGIAIAVPLEIDGRQLGAVGAEVRPASQAALRASMRQLQWGAAWMRDVLRSEQLRLADGRYAYAIHALDAVVGVAEQQDFPTAARAAVTDLATRFECDRVSVGFHRRGRSEVAAISHSAQFGQRMNLVRMLGAAMDEAIDQRGVVIYPADRVDEPMATHRHEQLARAHGGAHILTAPLYVVDRFVGALVFERPAEHPFTQQEADLLEAVSTVLAPVLDEKRQADRWLVTKAAEALEVQFTRVVGPGYIARKLVLAAALVLVVLALLVTGVDRISADARVEGSLQRTIAAPFDGFIAEALASAGDEVSEGDILLRLDDRELALQRLSLETQRQRHQLEYERALAARDRIETQVRQAQIEQVDAEIELVEQQIEHTRLTAPFDGLVTSGDLSQSIGAAVARGDVFLTIAPSDSYRVTLQVDERRIADVEVGQRGSLIVKALPDRSFPIVVEKITPVAEYGDGVTTFRVRASLEEVAPALRPGMEGVAKLDAGKERLVSIWTAPMRDWLKVWAWRWLPQG